MSKQRVAALGLCGLGLVVLATIVWAPAEIAYECEVRAGLGQGSCTFTNQNSLLPGRLCVRVHIHTEDGADLRAQATCSGQLWSMSTETRDVAMDSEVQRVCRQHDCTMSIAKLE